MPAPHCGVAQGPGRFWQQQPRPCVWLCTSPCGSFCTPGQSSEGEPVVYLLGISAQRQANSWAGAALGMLHRLQSHPVPSLHHATSSQGCIKIQTKINKQSPDLPERNCQLSSEQSFGKTYFSCFPVLAVLSGFVYLFLPFEINHCKAWDPLTASATPEVFLQAGCSRLPVHCCCTPRAPSTPPSFVPQRGEVSLVKPCSLQVTPASSHLQH